MCVCMYNFKADRASNYVAEGLIYMILSLQDKNGVTFSSFAWLYK